MTGSNRGPVGQPSSDNRLQPNRVSDLIIGACMEVHRALGPGLLESVYEECVAHELTLRNIEYVRQPPLRVEYKGISLDSAYRIDLVVQRQVIVELKATDGLLPMHTAQLLTYLRLTGFELGLLINFNVPVLRDGIKRVVNHLTESADAPR